MRKKTIYNTPNTVNMTNVHKRPSVARRTSEARGGEMPRRPQVTSAPREQYTPQHSQAANNQRFRHVQTPSVHRPARVQQVHAANAPRPPRTRNATSQRPPHTPHVQNQSAKATEPYVQEGTVIGVLLVVVCAVFLVLNIVVPDRTTSELENRSLEQFPSAFNEDVFSSLDSYVSDQFVGRDTLIHVNYLVKSLCSVSKIDDVYLGSGMLIEDAAETNEVQHARNIASINSFVGRHADLSTSFMLVPDAVSVQAAKLPAFANPLDQDTQIDAFYGSLSDVVNKVDVRSALNAHKDEYIFYKSDHHWTSLGAFYGAQALVGDISLDGYDMYTVASDFEGTLSNKTGSVGLCDTVDIYPPRNVDYVVTYESEGTQSRSIYKSEAFDKRDKYQVFFGGNEGLIRVETGNDSQKHLLLIKDSYANSLVQFLLPYYASITIVDPRYYYGDVDSLVSSDLITDVLFCYNTNTFVQDTSLADCLGGSD